MRTDERIHPGTRTRPAGTGADERRGPRAGAYGGLGAAGLPRDRAHRVLPADPRSGGPGAPAGAATVLELPRPCRRRGTTGAGRALRGDLRPEAPLLDVPVLLPHRRHP